MKNLNKEQSGIIHHLGLMLIIGVCLMVVVLAGWRVYKTRDNNAQAATNCYSYRDNRRLLCFAKQYQGYRYANYFNPALYKYIWGVAPSGSLGQNPSYWDSRERFSNSTNFLECSGFVNVMFYKSMANRTLFSNTNSQMYQNYVGYFFDKVTDLRNSLRAGDLIVIARDQDTTIGHVGIFSHYDYTSGTKVMVTYEASSSYGARSGSRYRNISQYDYALRYKPLFP